LGQLAGTENVTLTTGNMPAHNHPLTGTVTPQGNSGAAGLTDDPTNRRLAGKDIYTGNPSDNVNMAAAASTLAIGVAGGSQPFSIMPPYLGMNYIICLFGIFPSRD
jgi:microcystin-dependent protein